MAPSLLSFCFHRAAGALFSVVKPACCDSLVLSIVGMAWRRLSRMRNDTRIDGRGCASGRWRATKVPRPTSCYADACRQSILPQILIYRPPRTREDVDCQNVLPLYFADITLTEAFEPTDSPQWVAECCKHAVADVSGCCLDAYG